MPYNYPSNVNWGNWWSWNRNSAFAIDRGYDYVHVTAAWWSMYRTARNYPNLITSGTWQTYLAKAVSTVQALMSGRVGYTNVGWMGETVIRMLLDDLKREGQTSQATTIENLMRGRWQQWSTQRYP